MRAGLIQLTSGDDPVANLAETQAMISRAAEGGAGFVLTPEATNCISTSRSVQNEVLRHESDDATLDALRDQAAALGIWVLIGSLALKTDDADGRFANRSFLIGPDGAIAARYDKIHMFDVDIGDGEVFRESDAYRPGDRAVVADTPFGALGLSVCYDLRFPYLYRALAHAGARILTVPSAFHPVTGAAHWHVLLRARAIETGCYVLAPAQTGDHAIRQGRPRQSYGHSLAISPWGEVLADAGTEKGVVFVDLDPANVDKARGRVPSLNHDHDFKAPQL
ncbi:carbon-nitrogen hydrolase family protein [Actibacterium sp. XHP0104]|uniref:carbon-nitrogen hydrolase family protein n=1 Tax=Actibacterium sp. XHP0104 TaxID=2984335 RepID=UPI0021E8371D|nr:carbon-nitrogen hydrolase family protein [Actibacterium sp. XHP0104]MCV2882070.1 carbon-nitrogen hydrolase family protein [Actibacterium sp. XHP0104]